MGRRRRRRRRREENIISNPSAGFAGNTPTLGHPNQGRSSVPANSSASTPSAAAQTSRGSSGSAASQHSAISSWKTPERKEVATRPNVPGALRLGPRAYAKLQWFRDRGSTEISGFGLSYRSELLYVADFLTIKQKASAASVEFDDDALNKYLDDMVKVGWHPSEVLRIWLHTHPGNSASPSSTDVATFRDVFGGSDWSIMAILAKGGEFKAKFRYNIQEQGIVGEVFGGGREADLKVQLDINPPFLGVTQEDYEAWEEEYQANILTRSYTSGSSVTVHGGGSYGGCYDNYGGRHYGHYMDEQDWREWRNQWNRGDNEGTEGFETKTPANSDSSFSSARRRVASRSIFDQEEIPDWGGRHRLASGEDDPAQKLVSESVEQIWQIERYKNGTIVITDFGWYEYAEGIDVYASEEDDIDSLCDIATESPVAYGEITWRFVDGEYAPLKITRLTNVGHIIDLREDEEAADLELCLGNPKDANKSEKKAETGATGAVSAATCSSGSNGAPGFAEPDDATKTADEKKADVTDAALARRDTDVITISEVRKEVEAELAARADDGGDAVTAGEHATAEYTVRTGGLVELGDDDDAAGFAGP